jgi:hypothetical protein
MPPTTFDIFFPPFGCLLPPQTEPFPQWFVFNQIILGAPTSPCCTQARASHPRAQNKNHDLWIRNLVFVHRRFDTYVWMINLWGQKITRWPFFRERHFGWRTFYVLAWSWYRLLDRACFQWLELQVAHVCKLGQTLQGPMSQSQV